MIEFLTLFLGLATGPGTVELTATDEVAQIRVYLDATEVAVLEAPPWQAEIDLGPDLEPHLLAAVAYGEDGSELARTRQQINVPRLPAEARIVLERDSGANVVAARLNWESSIAPNPYRSRAWMNGEPLDATDPRRIPVPKHDKERFHFLRAELEFSLDVIAQAQTVFGGSYIDSARADLTAFPVAVRGKARKAQPRQMAGWFESSGEATRVSAFDKGGLDLVLVRGPGAGAAVRALEGTIGSSATAGGAASGSFAGGVAGPGAIQSIGNASVATATQRLQRIMALESGQRLRILAPRARTQAGHSVEMVSFALSPEITPDQGGLYSSLRNDPVARGLAPELRIADAVAVAGLQAANGNRRRGVLLVLADEAADASRHTARAVRDYLASIRVPLHVWRVGAAVDGAWKEWGRGEEITSFRELQGAARRLSDDLDRQRIVWVEGLHLPSEIRATAIAKVEPLGGR